VDFMRIAIDFALPLSPHLRRRARPWRREMQPRRLLVLTRLRQRDAAWRREEPTDVESEKGAAQ
jgi:hypothetical protein